MSLTKISAALKRKHKFLITAHTNPEGDALGAEIAFWWLLRKLGKTAEIINADSLPYGYDILSGTEKIKKFKKKQKKYDFDCFVLLDCSDLERCGELSRVAALRSKTILNIDHHISNSGFGDVNWVEPHASSCCEMVYKLYKAMRLPLNKEAALALYTGIVTDTGSFRYSTTSSFTHTAAAELIKFGLNVREIYNVIHENIPFSDIQLLTKILSRLKRRHDGKVVWFKISRKDLAGRKVLFDLSEQILTFGRSIKDVELVILFKENLGEKHEVRVNFRSHGKVDVNKLAKCFGGGGHKAASGATIPGSLTGAKQKVFAEVRKAISRL